MPSYNKVYIATYVRTYVHAHTHTYIYIYIYIYIYVVYMVYLAVALIWQFGESCSVKLISPIKCMPFRL